VPPFADGTQTGGMAVADQTGAEAVRVDGTLEDAWWSLYDHAANVDPAGRAPFRRLSLPDALRRLSDTDAPRLPESIRWKALTELGRSGGGELPRYGDHRSHYQTYLRQLPSKVPHDVVAQGDEAVQKHVEQTIQGELASPTEDICNIEEVVVDGHDAVWIFSEFETDETHEQLAGWVQPENWPTWGPIMFKEMSPLGEPKSVRSAAGEQHQNYLEVVSLAGRELQTVLRCDVKEAPPHWVGMTYDLVHSVDDVLTVDRGFLLASELPSGRRIVKALKVVGFKEPASNFLATLVCPVWTDFARQATRNAATALAESSLGPVRTKPDDRRSGSSDQSGTNPLDPRSLVSDLSGQWVQSMAGAVTSYAAQAQDVGLRLLARKYGREDAARDRRKLFVSLVRDWGRTWKAGIDLVTGMAAIDVPSTVAGPAVAGGTREFSTVAVPAPETRVPLAVSDFLHVDSDRATLKSSQLTAPPAIDPVKGEESVSVRIDVDTTAVEPGLYVGTLLSGSGQSQQKTAAHVYVSKARSAG
jgi:hypothetical protein